MNSAADRVMRIYDQHVPGAREAYATDMTTHYVRNMLRHVLAVAEIAMITEEIPEDVRFRILMTVAVGQPSTPIDAEQRLEMTKKLVDAHTFAPVKYLLQPDFPAVSETHRDEPPRGGLSGR